jgi:hypothetical protein
MMVMAVIILIKEFIVFSLAFNTMDDLDFVLDIGAMAVNA